MIKAADFQKEILIYFRLSDYVHNIRRSTRFRFVSGYKASFYKDKIYFREGDKPSVIEFISRNRTEISWIGYYKGGLLHRDESLGPASISSDGSWNYLFNGQVHRMNGPAVKFPDGSEEFWRHGCRISIVEKRDT